MSLLMKRRRHTTHTYTNAHTSIDTDTSIRIKLNGQQQKSWQKITENGYRSNTRVKAMRAYRMIWCRA